MTKQQKKLTALALAALVGAIFGGWLLRAFAPFLMGMALALAAEPLVRLQGKLGLQRKLASPLSVGAVLLILGTAVVLACRWVISLLPKLAAWAPTLLAEVSRALEVLGQQLLASAPAQIQAAADQILAQLETAGEKAVQWLLSKGVGLATDAVLTIPEVLLFLVTVVASAFLFSARLPGIWAQLRQRLPEAHRQRIRGLLKTLRSSVGSWFVAQCKLMGVTFSVLAVGLVLLGVPWAGAVAALIALVDALPVMGTGTVLIPWALVAVVQGDARLCLGLLGLYGAVTVMRGLLEPRVLGRQMGLSPLISLVAVYLGWKLMGVAGLILAPLMAICLREVFTVTREDPLASYPKTVYNQSNDG